MQLDKSKKKYPHFLLIACAIFLGMSGLSAETSFAQPSTPAVTAGCNPNFMRALNKKAEAEAFREVAIAQTYIKKPDSVFQLTCYDLMLGNASQVALFSDSSAPDTNLSALLQGTASAIAGQFIADNFQHSILGGFPIDNSGVATLPAGMPDNTLNHPYDITVSPQTYVCSQMNKVWWHAKCLDFDDTDFFYDGAQLLSAMGSEPSPPTDMGNISNPPAPNLGGGIRTQPHSASCATGPDEPWGYMLEISFNENDVAYAFRGYLDPSIPPAYSNALGGVSEPWFALIEAPGGGSGASCGPAILTGLSYTVSEADAAGTSATRDENTLCDGFCTNPGCEFTAPDASGGCTSNGNYCN